MTNAEPFGNQDWRSPDPYTNAPQGGTPWPKPAQAPAWATAGAPQGPPAPLPRVGPIIPFRPLTVGELFSGTFAAIRWNPKVMFTFSLLTMLAVGLLTGTFNAVVALNTPELKVVYGSQAFDLEAILGADESMSGAAGLIQGSLGILQTGAGMLISGMLVLSVTGAVVGSKLGTSATWQELKPRFWPLVGTSILLGLIIAGVLLASGALVTGLVLVVLSSGAVGLAAAIGIFLGLAVAALTIWVSVRLFMAPMITVVEKASPVRALDRSWEVTNGAFWRCLGRLLLVGLVVGAAVSILGGALSALIFALFGFTAPWLSALIGTLAFAGLSGATQPVSAAFTALMYVDERIRKEGLASSLEAALAANEAGSAR